MSIWGKRVDALFTPGRAGSLQGAQPPYGAGIPVSTEERAALMQSLTIEAAPFGTITPVGPFQLQLIVPGKKVNHVLHLLLSIFTAGVWLIVWLAVATNARPDERHILSVDEAGMTWVDNQPRPRGLGK